RRADDGDLRERRMLVERALDLGRIDVLAAADDHVLHAVTDVEKAVDVEVADVAAAEPAVGVEALRRGVRAVPVARGSARAAHADLATSAGFADRISRAVDQSPFREDRGPAARAELADGVLGLEEAHGRRRFRHAVALADRDVALGVEPQQRLRN